QRQRDYQRKRRISAQDPQSVPDILQQRVHPCSYAHVPYTFLNLIYASEFLAGLASGFARGHTGADFFAGHEVPVGVNLLFHLLVELLVQTVPAEEISPDMHETPEHSVSYLCGAQCGGYGNGDPLPALRLGFQLFTADPCQTIEPGTAIGFRLTPKRGEPTGLL